MPRQLTAIKQFVRKISMHNTKTDMDQDLIQEVDRELTDYYNQGFTLLNMLRLGQEENAWVVMYILERTTEVEEVEEA